MKRLLFISLFLFSCACIVLLQVPVIKAQTPDPRFPALQIHPLPLGLVKWQDPHSEGDYFNQIQDTPLGYLIWSKFPLKVYVDQPLLVNNSLPEDRRFRQWVELVTTGIKEWEDYLPLVFVEDLSEADIIVERKAPPQSTRVDSQTGRIIRERARTAQTTYQFYLSSEPPSILHHRMKIMISPNRNPEALLSAARHEFGHALGIWGHSDLDTDVMYYAQVRDYPQISPRDVNTLKKIYQQPTRLGWTLSDY